MAAGGERGTSSWSSWKNVRNGRSSSCGLTLSLALLLKIPGAKNAEAGSNGGRGAAGVSLLFVRVGAFAFGHWSSFPSGFHLSVAFLRSVPVFEISRGL